MTVSTTTPLPTSTGPRSTSFKVAATGFLAGLGTLVSGLVHTAGMPPQVQQVAVAVGSLVSVIAVVAKLFHDKGLHVATLQAAGTDVAQALPKIRTDLATVAGVASEWGPTKELLDQLSPRVSAIETRIAAVPDVEAIVESVFRRLASAQTTAPPAATPH